MAQETKDPLFSFGSLRIGKGAAGRVLGLLPCFVMGGCSFFWEDVQPKPDPAPYVASSLDDLKKAAATENLAPPLEVAGPIAANAISVAPWIICLRSGATEQTRARVYSVFFRESKFTSIQPSAIVDGCEAQSFVPLQTNTATTARAPGPAHAPSKRP